jgi:hypothetical protein
MGKAPGLPEIPDRAIPEGNPHPALQHLYDFRVRRNQPISWLSYSGAVAFLKPPIHQE